MRNYTIFLLLFFPIYLTAQNISSIISSTESKYSNLKVYLDSGKVISSFYNLPQPHKSALLFRTAYRSTGEYNFEFYQLGTDRLHIVNRDENNKVQVLNGSTIKTGSTFSLAVAGATGISSSTVGMITNLLMPSQNGLYGRSIFQRMIDVKLQTLELINGIPCYKLVGKENKFDNDGYVIVWISKEGYLIHQIEIDRKVNDFRVKTKFLYKPYTLKVYPNDLFKFQPDRKVPM